MFNTFNNFNSIILYSTERTEERAQVAEERAIQAETELKQALEKIRAFERSASRLSSSTHSARGTTGQRCFQDSQIACISLPLPLARNFTIFDEDLDKKEIEVK